MANSKLTIYTDHGSSDEDVEVINPAEDAEEAAEPEALFFGGQRLEDFGMDRKVVMIRIDLFFHLENSEVVVN